MKKMRRLIIQSASNTLLFKIYFLTLFLIDNFCNCLRAYEAFKKQKTDRIMKF